MTATFYIGDVQALKDGLSRSSPASQEMMGKRWGFMLDALERAKP